MTGGIYRILNLLNRKSYIGQTINFAKRWRQHKNTLRSNKHKNSYLQNAWNKQNGKGFAFIPVERCLAEQLLVKERIWIDSLNTLGDGGYNLDYPTLDGSKVVSKKTKERISIKRKGIGFNNQNGAGQFQLLTPIGNLIKGFNLRKFCRENNLNASCIYFVLNGKHKQHKGYMAVTEDL